MLWGIGLGSANRRVFESASINCLSLSVLNLLASQNLLASGSPKSLEFCVNPLSSHSSPRDMSKDRFHRLCGGVLELCVGEDGMLGVEGRVEGKLPGARADPGPPTKKWSLNGLMSEL